MRSTSSKSAGTDRHSPQQRGPDTSPEPHEPFLPVRLGEGIPHRFVPLLLAEAISLHLGLDDVEGVRGDPEEFARDTAVSGDLPSGNVLALTVDIR
ncbi:hypothetical protein D0859_16719 [Hortaea werneckii]|uniref:Uncharacterized protein n=1 Tax=Hortaea werneckii TaxID=91943 RepID=A0A3M7I170_HORWE|nr:hypothetical protein D0859_16719 [Hortaea werneckii]